MRVLPAVVTLLIAACLCGCLPVTTRVPAGTTVGFSPDPDLIGNWAIEDPVRDNVDTHERLQIVANPDGTMTATWTSDEDDRRTRYLLQIAALGENHIVSAQMEDEDGPEDPPPPSYDLMYYGPYSGGRVAVYMADRDVAAGAIRSGVLAGEIDTTDGDVTITSDPARLDDFLSQPEGAELFKAPFLILKKLS